ncbi:MAG: hypothetical protein RLY16_2882 [Bacteroidota bacterium]|jgi:hypothetical protein
MKRENTNKEAIENLIESINAIKRADTGDFFYAKVKGKLEASEPNLLVNNWLQPSFAIISLFILFLLNWATLNQTTKVIPKHGKYENVEKIHPGVWELKDELVGSQNFSYE